MSSKKKFTVKENENIQDCLARMEQEGYTPVRRIEKPVFMEEKKKGKIEYKPISQKIIFEGVKK
ncbi:NETI motif-containing protein [Siminovitchia sediminis]|uniref:NETI motif-containing protein n=1 Tax=Siminovitchia sediminis TaxID=1274353 RepID=A0ABW4KPR5_9BACI